MGSMLGMAAAMVAVSYMQPSFSRQMMRKGRCMARQFKRKISSFS